MKEININAYKHDTEAVTKVMQDIYFSVVSNRSTPVAFEMAYSTLITVQQIHSKLNGKNRWYLFALGNEYMFGYPIRISDDMDDGVIRLIEPDDEIQVFE